MKLFRLILVFAFIAELIYTIIVVNLHGWNLFPIFIESLTSLTWIGQFNLDFAFFLSLTGLWIAWRNRFSKLGIGLGLFTLIGGILFVSIYLLILSFKFGNIKEILFGENS